MSPRRNWDSPTPSFARVCPSPGTKGWGAGHTRLGLGGGGVPQSKELVRGPPELVQHFRLKGEFTSAQWRCMT
jgi:hypothetical protein